MAFHQKLTRLINPSELPEQLGSLTTPFENLVDQLYYKNLHAETDAEGSSVSYYLELLCYEKVALSIPGTGITLLLNPEYESNDPATVIPVSLTYKLGIKKYLPNFSLQNFSFQQEDFLALGKNILGSEDKELIFNAVTIFLSDHDNPLTKFAEELNNSGHLSNPIPLPLDNDYLQAISDIQDHVDQHAQNTLLELMFLIFIKDQDSVQQAENFEQFISQSFGNLGSMNIYNLLIPKISASFNANVGIEFSRNILIPVEIVNGNEQPVVDPSEKFLIKFDAGELFFDSKGRIGFHENLILTPDPYPKALIGNTGFSISFSNAQLDLSENTSIPEVTAVGYPPDFTGVFIPEATIGLPSFLPEDSGYAGPQASIIGKNLIIGTGGFSGTLTLDDSGNQLGLKTGSQNGFSIALNQFSLTFQQNAIIGSSIFGTLTLPGFKDETGNPAEIGIEASFTSNGDFAITASQDSGLPLLKSDTSQDVMEIHLNSLEVGREDDKYFVALSGTIDLTANVPGLGPVLPKGIEVKKLIIWQDGKIEIEGGGISLPSSVSMQAGPVDFSVTNIHLGSTRRNDRQYRYIGFDGSVGVNPGGVDARGDGIKYYYTTDGGTFDHFLRIAGIGIDLIIPSDASEANAQLILSGYLAVKNPENGGESTEYAGSIEFILPNAGIAGGAAMRLNPDKPAFIIDAGLEFDNPIPLGSTGLGFYGFRGLFGRHYTVSQEAAGLDPGNEDQWWEYYKAEVPPTNSEGVHVGKFSDENPGISVGAGTSIATTQDAGYSFSSKIFFMLGHPGVFLLQGQANFLGERVGMTDDDPPFHAMLAISETSVQAGIGADYQLPDSGSIIDLKAEMRLAFFFNDATGWYINFGEDTPEHKRIRAKLFNLFDGYSYLMINATMIRAGAGIEWGLKKDYKRASISAEAFLNAGGFIIYRPAQVGGHIALGGSAYIEVLRISLGLSVEAMLAAEAPKPFIIEGKFMLAIKVSVIFTSIEYSVQISFEWKYDEDLNMDEIDVISPPGPKGRPAVASHIPTGLDYPVAYCQKENDTIPAPTGPEWDKSFGDEITIPQDSFIDIEFNEAVDPTKAENIGGRNLNMARFRIKVPPERGKSDQVEHTFTVNSVEIFCWDESASEWKPYEIYKHMKPVTEHIEGVNESDIEEIPDGFWQYNNPGFFNKIRLLAQNSFSFVRPGQDGFISWDAFSNRTMFLCENPVEMHVCYNWDGIEDLAINHNKSFYTFNLKVIHELMILDEVTNTHGMDKGLMASTYEKAIIEFYDPVNKVQLRTKTLGVAMRFKTYDDNDNLIEEVIKTAAEMETQVILESGANWIKSVKLENIPGVLLPETENNSDFRIGKRHDFHTPQVLPGALDDIRIYHKVLSETEMSNVKNFNTSDPSNPQQPTDIKAWWKLDGNAIDSQGIHNGTSYNTLTVTGEKNDAKSFNGFNSYIAVPHHPDLALSRKNFTITYWIKTIHNKPGERDVRVILDKRVMDSGFHGYSAFIHNGRVGFQVAEGPYDNNLGETVISDGKWHFIAVTVDFDEKEGKIYVDNALDGEFEIPFVLDWQRPWYLFEVCSQNADSMQYAETRPAQSDIDANVQEMKTAVEKSTQPIWRPHTKFAVRVKTSDKLEAGDSDMLYEKTHLFGFQTAGPVGHFHQTDDRYDQLNSEDKVDEYPINDLQHYIDYAHSFSDARGKLTGAKPVYYESPMLYLAFKRPYVHAMYGNWGHDDLKDVFNDLKVRIYDVLNQEVDQSPVFKLNNYDYSFYSEDLKPLNRALQQTTNCTPVSSIGNRFTLNAQFSPPSLKPNKLYSAVFEAHTQIQGESNNEAVVHQYNFQTSRFKNFQEHINSIELGTVQDQLLKAVFPLPVNLSEDEHNQFLDIFTDVISDDNYWRAEYAHIFDRIWSAGLGLTSMESPETTEVNIISKDNIIIAFLLRSPEPFFKPGLNSEVLNELISIENDNHYGENVETSFDIEFSKDTSMAFITNNFGKINPGIVKIVLKHFKPGQDHQELPEEAEIIFDSKTYGDYLQYIPEEI